MTAVCRAIALSGDAGSFASKREKTSEQLPCRHASESGSSEMPPILEDKSAHREENPRGRSPFGVLPSSCFSLVGCLLTLGWHHGF